MVNKSRKKKIRKQKRRTRGGGNSCNILDSKFNTSENELWETCITLNRQYNIRYITCNNVIIKSIETAQVPEFYVYLRTERVSSRIVIENKYVSSFLCIEGTQTWYVTMRLFGTTFNTGTFARTEKNKAFYRLNNQCININLDTGKIIFKSGTYLEKNEGWFGRNSKAIILNPSCFENISRKDDVFDVIQRYRQEKVIANGEKEDILGDIGSVVVQQL
jgi:hypothetical protein